MKLLEFIELIYSFDNWQLSSKWSSIPQWGHSELSLIYIEFGVMKYNKLFYILYFY